VVALSSEADAAPRKAIVAALIEADVVDQLKTKTTNGPLSLRKTLMAKNLSLKQSTNPNPKPHQRNSTTFSAAKR
jgi:hypothetical protein